MTDTEVYDKFFIDEEYELEDAPTDTYSYRSGWNNALKRAAIIVRNEIRPQGEWIFDKENSFTIDMFKCSICGYFGHTHFKFCPDCGAKMKCGADTGRR